MKLVDGEHALLIPVSPIEAFLEHGQREWMAKMLVGLEDCAHTATPIVAAADLFGLGVGPVEAFIQNVHGQPIGPTNCIAFDDNLENWVIFF